MKKTSGKRRPTRYFFSDPAADSYHHTSAQDYLADQYAESELVIGQEVRVLKTRRKRFVLDAFRRAVGLAWDDIVAALEEEYAVDDAIGLEDCEDEFVAGASTLLLRLARRDALPRQCEEVEVQVWWWTGGMWRRQ